MAKRKQNGELILNKATWSSVEEVELEVEIHDFLEKIFDDGKKKKAVESPKFNLGGVEMTIRVYPDYRMGGSVGVFLLNHSDQDQKVSFTFTSKKSKSAGPIYALIQESRERVIIQANKSLGYPGFLSHRDYKKLAEEDGDVFKLEVSVSLHTKEKSATDGWTRKKLKLEMGETFSSIVQTIMEDDSTADFIIRCKSKAFHVHKTFFCARSPVFRAAMLSNMKKGQKGEMFIPDIDEKTLGTVIKYVYTDQLEMAEDQDLEMMINAADKYNLPGLVTLLCNQMREVDIKGERVADLLILAYKHGKEELRELALERIKANRMICKEEGFKERMEGVPATVLIDLLTDL